MNTEELVKVSLQIFTGPGGDDYDERKSGEENLDIYISRADWEMLCKKNIGEVVQDVEDLDDWNKLGAEYNFMSLGQLKGFCCVCGTEFYGVCSKCESEQN